MATITRIRTREWHCPYRMGSDQHSFNQHDAKGSLQIAVLNMPLSSNNLFSLLCLLCFELSLLLLKLGSLKLGVLLSLFLFVKLCLLLER